MKSYADYKATALPVDPFPNPADRGGFEFSVCCGGDISRLRCVTQPGGRCPLLRLAGEGFTPREWTNHDGRLIYRCADKTTEVRDG